MAKQKQKPTVARPMCSRSARDSREAESAGLLQEKLAVHRGRERRHSAKGQLPRQEQGKIKYLTSFLDEGLRARQLRVKFGENMFFNVWVYSLLVINKKKLF